MSDLLTICNRCCREIDFSESMPDPATNHGDFCFSCFEKMDYKFQQGKGIDFINLLLPSINDFMVGYKKHAKGKNLNPKSLENNCHAAAHTLVQLLNSKFDIELQRGHWVDIDVRHAGRVMQQHSWTLATIPNNSIKFIIDPTQWVFTGKSPYIAITDEDDTRYDYGGYNMKEAILGVKLLPARNGKLLPSHLSLNTQKWISKTYESRNWNEWCIDEMFFFANLNPAKMNGYAKDVFSGIIKSDNKGLIPLEGLSAVKL